MEVALLGIRILRASGVAMAGCKKLPARIVANTIELKRARMLKTRQLREEFSMNECCRFPSLLLPYILQSYYLNCKAQHG
jgi:hypothetical protein